MSGRPGGLLGPVTVHTNATSATVTPPVDAATSGVRIVGKDGKPLTAVSDGSQLFFDVPADTAAGSAELTVQASTTVPVGRAFTSDSRSQTQILAGSSESTVSATASATWAQKGAIPALSAAKNCAKTGVDIAAANRGDEAFTFELMGLEHTIPAGGSLTVTIPLQEDQAYDFSIVGPQGDQNRFTGVLDCRTQADEIAGLTTQTLSEPSPATVGGVSPWTTPTSPRRAAAVPPRSSRARPSAWWSSAEPRSCSSAGRRTARRADGTDSAGQGAAGQERGPGKVKACSPGRGGRDRPRRRCTPTDGDCSSSVSHSRPKPRAPNPRRSAASGPEPCDSRSRSPGLRSRTAGCTRRRSVRCPNP